MRRTLNVKKMIRRITGMLAAFTLAAGTLAAASEADRMPDLTGQSGNLKITLTYTKENEETGILPGATLHLYQVSGLTVEGGSAEYPLLAEFAQSNINFAGMTASQSNEAAYTLQELAAAGAGTGITGVTDANGSVTFTGLPNGMYLVYRDVANINQQDRMIMEPFLVSVPMAEPTGQGNSWIYDVTAMPKMIIPGPNEGYLEETESEETETETEKTKNETETAKETEVTTSTSRNARTGDETNIILWVALLAGCLVIILVVVLVKKHGRRK